MKEYLLRIVPTVKDLLQSQGCKEESEILHLNNINYEKSYDSFGNDYDIVVIEVQTDKYIALKKFKPIDKVEKLILSAFQEATSFFNAKEGRDDFRKKNIKTQYHDE